MPPDALSFALLGLRSSRFGVVVLSPSFSKYWTETELSVLFQQERAFEEKRILPILHQVDPRQVAKDWALLASAAGHDLDGAPGLDELLHVLAGHALAVELAGAYLNEFPEETPTSYLVAQRAGEDVEEPVRDFVRYERTVHQAFETLWQRLDEDTRNAWRLAACFEPEMVTPELSDAVGLTASLRHRLRQLHLIEVELAGRWRMHRLTRRFVRESGSTEESGEAREAFVSGCASFSDRIELADGFHLYLPNRAHLDAALRQVETSWAKARTRPSPA